MFFKNLNNKKKEQISAILDYIPAMIFLLIYNISKAEQPLIDATIYLIVTTIVVLIVIYFLTKKISPMPLISAVILSVFGTLSIFSGNDVFIKIKPTIINVIFALILFGGNFLKKPLLAKLLGKNIKMSDKNWLILSFRFALFFIFLAILNEVIWRNFSTNFWVNFKIFGMFILSCIFTLSQAPFLFKNQITSD